MGLLAITSFLGLLGTVGTLELDRITLAQCLARSLVFLAIFYYTSRKCTDREFYKQQRKIARRKLRSEAKSVIDEEVEFKTELRKIIRKEAV